MIILFNGEMCTLAKYVAIKECPRKKKNNIKITRRSSRFTDGLMKIILDSSHDSNN